MIVDSCRRSAGYQIDYETTNSLSFLLVRRAKLARHENDHAVTEGACTPSLNLKEKMLAV